MKFTWYGKENAIIESMTPSTGTLRPDKESSKNWDDTENLYIEGDNLEVLKLLQKSYFGKVKMIYIDPPYNTGKDFIYKDNFRDNIANYKEVTSQTTKANPETNGRYHTDWLNMMYPRLKLARNLLREEGVIFISIDDKELNNLKKICDEIFGEENFISVMSIITGANQSGEGVKIQKNIEYVIIYGKNELYTIFNKVDKTEETLRNLNDAPTPLETRLDMGYTIYFNEKTKDIVPLKDYDRNKVYLNKEEEVYSNCLELIDKGYIPIRPGLRNKKLHRWRWGIDTFIERKNEIVILNKNGKYNVFFKQQGYNPAKNIQTFSAGTNELKKLFNDIKIFDYPKNTELVKYLVSIGSNNKSIVMDFFSGTSSTAHSVLKYNLEREKNIKFIMVQLPEKTEKKSEAYKAGYKNICEIGKERIRRAGDKIISENKDKEGIENLDIGFKVFKLEYNCGGENYSMMEEGIRVDIIKRPKDKPICKFKVDGELYYLIKTNEDIIVFPYKSSIKGKAIASIFNIELCKNKDYMQLEYLYNMKLNEFNGEDFIHSQYVTSVILDNVYKNLNE